MPTHTLMPMRRAAHRLLAPAAGWLALAATLALPLPAAADPPHARAVAASQPAQADETSLRTLHSFHSTYDAALVRGKLTLGPDGYLYGASRDGGSNGCGSAFKLSPAAVKTVIFEFGCGKLKGDHANGGLVFGPDGALYGTTALSGKREQGDIFRLTLDGKYTQLYALDDRTGDGMQPDAGLALGGDGRYYGTTSGGFMASSQTTVFAIDLATNAYTLLHRFRVAEGYGSRSPLTLGTDGWLYGTQPYGGAHSHGTIYRIATDGQVTVLHSFRGGKSEGAAPWSEPVQAANGLFYGTTSVGGANGAGTVYAMTPSGVVTTLHSFDKAMDGSVPYAPLILAPDGWLYGTASRGGRNGLGTQFRISTAGAFETLHHFAGAPGDGATPGIGFTAGADGALYAATETGGAFNQGTVYRQNMAGETSPVYSFGSGTAPDAKTPTAGLLLASDGMFYGTTDYSPGDDRPGFYRISANGKYEFINRMGRKDEYSISEPFIEREPGEFVGVGSSTWSPFIYSIHADGVPRTLHRFGSAPNDPARLSGGLVKARDGNIYGTSYAGGLYNRGTIYRMSPDNVVTVIHSFGSIRDGGSFPTTTLALGQDGALYGKAANGDPSDTYPDIIYKITTAGVFTTLYTLPPEHPEAVGELMMATNGFLYGVLHSSSGNHGGLFSLSPSGEFKVVHLFLYTAPAQGRYPEGPLMQARDGHLYGTTYNGGTASTPLGYGTLFRLTLDGQFDVMHSFTGRRGGGFPNGKLVQGADDALYGTTTKGGAPVNNSRSDGTVFKLIGPFGPQK